MRWEGLGLSSAVIRKDLHSRVVLYDGVAMFQGICGRERVFVSVTVSVVVSLGAKPAQAEGMCWIAHRLGVVTLLHICFPCHRTVVHT